MSKTKKALVNTVLVALVMVAYQLLINNVNLGFLPMEVAINATLAFEFVLSFIYSFILFSLLILIWGKNKYLLAKPLFDKSQPILKRFNIGKLVLLFATSACFHMVSYMIRIISFIISADFNLELVIGSAYMALFWLVLYFIVAGKGHHIFQKSKYGIFAGAIILLVTVVCTVVNIRYFMMMESLPAQSGNISAYIVTLEYSEYSAYANTFSSIVAVSVLVFFHTLSAPEAEPLEAVTEATEVTE